MTNCVNCAAPLSGSKCEYCGTIYRENNVIAQMDESGFNGGITIGGNTFSVYLAEVEVKQEDPMPIYSGGRFLRISAKPIHKFTLVER